MKKIFILISLCLFICGCRNDKDDKFEKIMAENDYVIIDVRTEEEYNGSHIVDSINIPYDQIYESIDIDKEMIVFVYCKSGNRSSIAYSILKELGYTVYDLGAFSNIDMPKE